MPKFSIELTNKIKPLMCYYNTANLNQLIVRNFSQSNYNKFFNKKNSIEYKSRRINEINLNQYLYLQNRNFAQWGFFGLFGGKSTNDKNATTLENKVSQPVSEAAKPTEATIPTEAADSTIVGYIPEPPEIPIEEALLNSLGEPTLQSLGLGSYFTPVGWIQLILENIHTSFELPWYLSILIYTIIIRTCILPLSIAISRNSTKFRIVGPQMTELNQKIAYARMSGNKLEEYKAVRDISNLFKVNELGLSMFLYPMAQAPIIMSTFIALRKMCQLPVESMSYGGALWFQNLIITDPYFVLPLMSGATLLLMIHKGIDMASAQSMTPVTRLIMYAMPAAATMFLIFQPTGIAFYLVCSNLFSLLLASVLRVKSVKKYFKIPIITKEMEIRIKEQKKKSNGFIGDFKESFKTSKLTNEIEERRKYKMQQFEKAALGSPLKTYKSNPKDDKKQIN